MKQFHFRYENKISAIKFFHWSRGISHCWWGSGRGRARFLLPKYFFFASLMACQDFTKRNEWKKSRNRQSFDATATWWRQWTNKTVEASSGLPNESAQKSLFCFDEKLLNWILTRLRLFSQSPPSGRRSSRPGLINWISCCRRHLVVTLLKRLLRFTSSLTRLNPPLTHVLRSPLAVSCVNRFLRVGGWMNKDEPETPFVTPASVQTHNERSWRRNSSVKTISEPLMDLGELIYRFIECDALLLGEKDRKSLRVHQTLLKPGWLVFFCAPSSRTEWGG